MGLSFPEVPGESTEQSAAVSITTIYLCQGYSGNGKKSNNQISSNCVAPNDLKFEVIEIMWQMQQGGQKSR